MSEAFRHTLILVNRVDFVLQCAARSERVLHVGCTDAPYTRERLVTNELLHARLAHVAPRLVGVDVSEEGLALLRRHNSAWDLRHVDVEQDSPGHVEYDCVILGEVLEHLGRPLDAIENLRKSLVVGGKLVVTTPSAHAIKGAVRALRGIEVVHPDHFAYYSPRVLTELLRSGGMSWPTFTGQYLAGGSRTAEYVNRLLAPLARRGAAIGDGIIVVVERN